MKKLLDLKITDLREELDKRGLKKGGTKSILIDRLKTVLEEEGHDPKTYDFDAPYDDEINEEANTNEVDIKMDDKTTQNELKEDAVEDNCDATGDNENNIDEESAVKKEEESSEVQEEIATKEDCKEENEPAKEGEADVSSQEYEGIEVLYDDEDKLLDDELLYDDGNESHDDEGNTKKKKLASSKESGDSGKKDSSKSNKDVNKYKRSSSDKSDSRSDKDSSTTDNDSVNLWVSGLEKSTKAQDLKALFTKHGKVVSVKIVMNAKSPGKCFGFVQMSSKEDAAKCITELNQTELNGKKITVEISPVKVKNDSQKKDVFKKAESKKSRSRSRDRKRRSTSSSRRSGPLRDMQDRKLFIGGLDPSSTTQDLRKFFEKYGTLTDVVVMKDPETRKTRRFGFVTFESKSASRKALEERPHKIDGMVVDTKEATPRAAAEFDHKYGRDKYRERERDRDRDKERDRGRDRDRGRSNRTTERARDSRRRTPERRGSLDYRDSYEKDKLARERDQLRKEREEIQRQKRQLMRLEREKLEKEGMETQLQLRLERQKLEQERQEFMRQQMRFNTNDQWGNNSGMGVKRGNDGDYYGDFNKRQATDSRSNNFNNYDNNMGGMNSFGNNDRSNHGWGSVGRNMNDNYSMGMSFNNGMGNNSNTPYSMMPKSGGGNNWRSDDNMMNNRNMGGSRSGNMQNWN